MTDQPCYAVATNPDRFVGLSHVRDVVMRAAALALGCLLISIAESAWCQSPDNGQLEVLTLAQALQLATQDNLSIKNAQLEVTKATDSVSVSRTRLFPRLDLNLVGSHNLDDQNFLFKQGVFGNYSGGPIPAQDVSITSKSGTTGVVSVSITQPLSQLYRANLTIDQREVGQSIAEQQLRGQRQETTKQVKQQYFTILKTQSGLEATEESIVYYTSLAELTDRYVQEQTALAYQSMEVKSRLAEARHRGLKQRNSLESEQERLNVLLGRDVKTKFKVDPRPQDTFVAVDPASAETTALAQRPEMREAQLKLEHAEYGYRIKKSEYIPDVDLRFRYTRLDSVEFIPNEEKSIDLSLRWEIYDWGRKSDELGSKTADVMQAQNQVTDVKSKIIVEVNDRMRKLEDARAMVEVTELTRAASREKLRVLTNQYRQQAALLQNVLQAESEYANATNEYNQAVFSVWTAQADLQKAMGDD